MPNGHPIHFPDYPQLDPKEYKAKLKAYLVRLFHNDELTEIERISGFQVKNEDDLKMITEYLQGQVELQGINPRLPFYHEIMEETMTPQWAAGKREAYLGEVGKWRAGIKERKPWLKMGVSEEDFLRKQYGFPTRYEAELADWKRKVEAQKGMWGDWQQEQQLEQYRRAALDVGIGRRMEARAESQWEQPQADRARIWENTQREMLGQLDPDRDWLKIRDIKQRRNPHITDPESATDDRVWAEESLKKAESWVKTADAMMKTAKDPETQLSKGEMEYVKMAYHARDRALRRVAEAQQGEQDWITQQGAYAGAGAGGTGMETATGITYGGGAPPAMRPPPTTPKTPQWLAGMYPEMGKRLPEKGTGFQPLAPSGQQWGGLTPSQQQRWGGFTEYYGKKPEDLLAQMQRMLPRTPQIARGWTPARQMA